MKKIILLPAFCLTIVTLAMQQNTQPSAPAKKVDLFMSRIESLLSRNNSNQDIIAMYESNLERRNDVYARIAQAQKPLLLEAFDAINQQEQRSNSQYEKNNERDALDILEEQHGKDFEQQYANVCNTFHTTGNLKPAQELLNCYRTQNAPYYCCNTLGLFVAKSESLQQKTTQPLKDFIQTMKSSSAQGIDEQEGKILSQILADVEKEIAHSHNNLRVNPEPSAPELPSYEDALRAPDAPYQDILLPGYQERQGENGNPQMRLLNNAQAHEQALALFLTLSPDKKEEALLQLVSINDEATLKQLKRSLPDYKKIDEALQLLAPQRASIKVSKNEMGSGTDFKEKPSLLQDLGKLVSENPVETTVAAAGIASFIWYLTRNKDKY